MGLIYTHDTFWDMADAILRAAGAKDFPGIVPYSDPAIMAIGYIKAAPRSWRTPNDQWRISVQSVKDAYEDRPRFDEVEKKLQALVKLGHQSFAVQA